MSPADTIGSPSPKKLLSLDGGGIRGLVTVEVLAEIERQLREKHGKPDLVLADYFDYVAGTSTGAIIATCVSLGMTVEDIRTFYVESGREMFDKASLFKRLHYTYEDEPIARKLKQVLGADTTLGSERLKTLLMMVLRNVTTDSPWPLSNNPRAKYNDRSRADCNLNMPLWQLIRASTAAPVYFPPEVVTLGSDEDAYDFVFVDGGITPYNNPAFLLFLMATVKAYRLEWPTGVDQMLLVSIGTGAAPRADEDLHPSQLHILNNAKSLPGALMYGASTQQDTLCRIFGHCKAGGHLDREIGTLMGAGGTIQGTSALGSSKHFTYVRYNAELTSKGLEALGVPDIDPSDIQKLDSVDHMDALQRVGKAVGQQQVQPSHFDGFTA
ncbi:MAG: patatin-like phospholipase family protein [Pseudomonadota bacterium]